MNGHLPRRDVLKATAATVPLAAMAGCSGGAEESGEERNDRPDYARWLPAEGVGDEPETFHVYIDWAGLEELDDENLSYEDGPDAIDGDIDSDTDFEDVDPLSGLPVLGLFVATLSMGVGLFGYGFAPAVLNTSLGALEETDDADDNGTSLESVLFVDGVFIFEGDIDVEAVVAETEGFEAVGERDGFEIYEGNDEETIIDVEDLAFAIDDRTVIAPIDDDRPARPRLDAILDMNAGTGDRLGDEIDDADWGLRAAGNADLVFGGWGGVTDPEPGDVDADDDAFDVLDDTEGFVSSLSFTTEEATGRLAAVYSEGEMPDRERLESEVGHTAADRDIDIDGTRLSVVGTWPATDDGSG